VGRTRNLSITTDYGPWPIAIKSSHLEEAGNVEAETDDEVEADTIDGASKADNLRRRLEEMFHKYVWRRDRTQHIVSNKALSSAIDR
jgi:hypothetical protein